MVSYKMDFHIHTSYSDGQASPTDIINTAKLLGYEKIAITDHDGTDGLYEASCAAAKCGITLVNGIELATETEEGIGLHILGYDIDPENKALKDVLENLRNRRIERNVKLLNVLKEMGYDIDDSDLLKKQPNGYIGKPVIARLLVEKGYAESVSQVFASEDFLASPKTKAVKKSKLLAEEAIGIIKGAGGRAVLAHPIQTRHIGKAGSEEFYVNIEKIILTLVKQGIEGIECLHPDQNEAQTLRFLEMAERYSLFVTRGSDFHGKDYAKADKTADVSVDIGF